MGPRRETSWKTKTSSTRQGGGKEGDLPLFMQDEFKWHEEHKTINKNKFGRREHPLPNSSEKAKIQKRKEKVHVLVVLRQP